MRSSGSGPQGRRACVARTCMGSCQGVSVSPLLRPQVQAARTRYGMPRLFPLILTASYRRTKARGPSCRTEPATAPATVRFTGFTSRHSAARAQRRPSSILHTSAHAHVQVGKWTCGLLAAHCLCAEGGARSTQAHSQRDTLYEETFLNALHARARWDHTAPHPPTARRRASCTRCLCPRGSAAPAHPRP